MHVFFKWWKFTCVILQSGGLLRVIVQNSGLLPMNFFKWWTFTREFFNDVGLLCVDFLNVDFTVFICKVVDFYA